nr:MAG TPA: hypothetical protein [Caudoviricetes sp.]
MSVDKYVPLTIRGLRIDSRKCKAVNSPAAICQA